MSKLNLIIILATISLSSCTPSATETKVVDPTTRINIDSGVLIGTRGRDNAKAWYGIPFAQPPIHDLRWRAPRPEKPWQGEFLALNKEHQCTQYANKDKGPHKRGDLIGSEDCLYLNVWAPSESNEKKYPVMLWIHGGSNLTGHAGAYEMGRLAEAHKLVIVSTNYRLGPFGWFAHPSIRETADTELDLSANFGNLDTLMALKWIQKNIDKFSGDANKVTIFGESAGAYNVAALLASPKAENLFHRAIMQSGGFKSATIELAEQGLDRHIEDKRVSSSQAINQLFLNMQTAFQRHPDGLASFLRRQSAETIFEAYRSASEKDHDFTIIDMFDITADGVFLPISGTMSIFEQDVHLNSVPILMGTNKDEFLGLGFLDDELTEKVNAFTYRPKDEVFYLLNGEYPDRLWRALGAEEPAKKLVRKGHKNVFTYRFDWDEQGKKMFTDISKMVGAAHALEVAFVTGGFDDPVNDPMELSFTSANKASREALSDIMTSYWAEFAYSGTPNKGRDSQLPFWSAWKDGDNSSKSMLFDSPQGGGVRVTKNTETVEALLTQLEQDQRFTSNEQRCKVLRKMLFLAVRLRNNNSDIFNRSQKYCRDSSADQV